MYADDWNSSSVIYAQRQNAKWTFLFLNTVVFSSQVNQEFVFNYLVMKL